MTIMEGLWSDDVDRLINHIEIRLEQYKLYAAVFRLSRAIERELMRSCSDWKIGCWGCASSKRSSATRFC